LFKLSKKVVISEFLPKIFILNAVYRDEALGGTNISSDIYSTFQSCDKIFWQYGVFVHLYPEKAYPGFQSLCDVSIYYLLSKALESRVEKALL
jgi:hypothetical protein